MNKDSMTLKEINDRHGILNEQLNDVIEVAAAVETLLDPNPDPERRGLFETVQAAAKVLADADLVSLGEGPSGKIAKTDKEVNDLLKNAGTNKVSLSEILKALDTRERRIRFDRQELLEYTADIYMCNRIDTVQWLEDQISESKDPSQVEAYKATLEQLMNVENLRLAAS